MTFGAGPHSTIFCTQLDDDPDDTGDLLHSGLLHGTHAGRHGAVSRKAHWREDATLLSGRHSRTPEH